MFLIDYTCDSIFPTTCAISKDNTRGYNNHKHFVGDARYRIIRSTAFNLDADTVCSLSILREQINRRIIVCTRKLRIFAELKKKKTA